MTAKKKKLILIFAVIAILFTVLMIWIFWGNQALELNRYTVSSERLPADFEGYRIAHISDLHNTEISVSLLQKAEPDMIAITGDLIDTNETDVEIALRFVAEAVEIAPCYYVTGNHEANSSEYESLKNGLINLGVTVLENESIVLKHKEEELVLIGLNDPSFNGINEEILEEEQFTVLLSHRPELFDLYAKNEIDLVLAGHAHGGQIRIPFIGGVIAPNQGVFPKYDAGLYVEGNTHMIVSRGIGNSVVPIRINNRPEIVLIELTKQ